MPFLKVLVFLLVSSSVHAVEETNFDQWNLLCGEYGNCALSQVVSVDPQGKKVLLGASVNFAVSTDFPTLILRLPASLNSASGVGIKIDDKKAIQVALSQCTQVACQSVIKMDEQLIQEMSEGKLAQVAFAIEKGKQMTLPLSLAGFSEGFKTLVKRNGR